MKSTRSITIDREQRNGAYGDIIDAAMHLANGDYGSGVNAIAVMVRQSPLFKQAQDEMQAEANTVEPAAAASN